MICFSSWWKETREVELKEKSIHQRLQFFQDPLEEEVELTLLTTPSRFKLSLLTFLPSFPVFWPSMYPGYKQRNFNGPFC